MNYIQLFGAVEMGLIYSLVAIGVYLSFRTLDFPDLTVDGSFPLGAAVCAAMITGGYSPMYATLCAILAGCLAGLVTAWLSTHLKMLNLLAGILTMMALYSINIRIMGKPNVALLGDATIFTQFNNCLSCFGDTRFLVIFGMIVLVFLGIYWFLNTRCGLAMRSVGNNPRMGRAQGIDDKKMIWLGLSISNALVAFAGALFCQAHGFSDVNMGIGTIIIGLASVIIGEAILPTRKIIQCLVACIAGAIIYRIVISAALNVGDFGLLASDLNLLTALLVAGAMLLPSLKRRIKAL